MKADARFDRGIFLGKNVETDEHIIGAEDYGVVTARTVKRMEPSKQHDKGLLLRMCGVPWDKNLGKAPSRRLVQGASMILIAPLSADVATDREEQAAEGAMPEASAEEPASSSAMSK